MIIVGSAAFAQIKPAEKNNLLLSLQFKREAFQSFLLMQPPLTLPKPATSIRPDFYAKQLGFFCRQEIEMDKAVKIPFRFRLGSVEQCNWLEGKNKR